MLHKNVALGDRHAAHNWEYADATARTSATGFVAGDVGKLARQISDNTLWMLSATTPTWVAVGSGDNHTHANKTALDAVSGINTGDQTLASLGAQAELVSGTNIKTINGQSVLGSGDLTITGGSSGTSGLENHFLLMGC